MVAYQQCGLIRAEAIARHDEGDPAKVLQMPHEDGKPCAQDGRAEADECAMANLESTASNDSKSNNDIDEKGGDARDPDGEREGIQQTDGECQRWGEPCHGGKGTRGCDIQRNESAARE